MDQETRKISASQLATVLAKADADVAAAVEEEEKRDEAAAQRPGPHPAAGQPLAVVERPVGDAKVVNATSPEAPAHSSGRMPAAAAPPPEPEAEPAAAKAEPELKAEAPAQPEVQKPTAKYESLPVQLPVKSSRLAAALVVLLFVACCVVLVLSEH